jgi:hypothetical protein
MNFKEIKISEMIHMIHNFTSVYFLFGWMIPSQRVNLVLLIPSLQYQFLVNNNMCVLTQLENYYSEEKEKTNSFTDKKLKEYGISMSDINRERMINSFLYLSFLISYSSM